MVQIAGDALQAGHIIDSGESGALRRSGRSSANGLIGGMRHQRRPGMPNEQFAFVMALPRRCSPRVLLAIGQIMSGSEIKANEGPGQMAFRRALQSYYTREELDGVFHRARLLLRCYDKAGVKADLSRVAI